MSFLIHLLIFSLLPCLSTSSYEYGIIGNASIKTLVNIDRSSVVQNCNACLCDAFQNSDKVHLFTCTESVSNVICQFYYSMRTRDEIEYPRYDTSIYLMKKETLKDNCCNTEYLVRKIKKKIPGENFINKDLRSLIKSANNTIVTIAGTSVFIFNESPFQYIMEKPTNETNIRSIGYWDHKYYLGTTNSIEIYDETLTTKILNIPIGNSVTTIRFLNGTYMLAVIHMEVERRFVVRVYEKDGNGNFTQNIPDLAKSDKQIRAIGIVNQSALYVGWDHENMSLVLYTRDQTNGAWINSTTDSIPHNEKTSDIVVEDKCKRIWVTEGEVDDGKPNHIFIYDQNKTRYNITLNAKQFNILILEDSNYTLLISHESSNGLVRIQPDVYCQ